MSGCETTWRKIKNDEGAPIKSQDAGKDVRRIRQEYEKIAFGGSPGDGVNTAPSSHCFFMSEKGCVNLNIGIGLPTESQARKKWTPVPTTTREGTMVRFHTVDKSPNGSSFSETLGTKDWRTKAMLKNARGQISEKGQQLQASAVTAGNKEARVIPNDGHAYRVKILVVTRRGDVDLNLVSF